MMNKEISRVIWITGAGKGIGRELARHYAGNGWTVAVSARTLADLQTLALEMPVSRVKIFPLDVTDTEAVRVTVRKIED
jgi:NADP-dependent 3-hydroxy acid dehydrogenase YdfG